MRRAMLEQKMNPLFLSPERFLVAEDGLMDGDGVVGFAQLRPVSGAAGAALELASVFVTPAYRRRGVGAELVRRLLDREGACASRGIQGRRRSWRV